MFTSTSAARTLVLLLVLTSALTSGLAADATYDALRAAKPNGRSVAVKNVILVRDVVAVRLEEGRVHFFGADQRTSIAVFLGRGRLELRPATAGERRYLAQRRKDPQLEVFSEDFDKLVLLFADDTAEELSRAGAVETGTPDAAAAGVYSDWLDVQRKKLGIDLHLRLLRGLTDAAGRAHAPFFAAFSAKTLGWAVAAVDPLGSMGAEETALWVLGEHGGTWYASHLNSEVKSGAAADCRPRQAAEGVDYKIDTNVSDKAWIEGTCTVRVRAVLPGITVLPFDLAPPLRLSEVARVDVAADGEKAVPLPFIQDGEEDEGNAAVILPRPLATGEEFTLRLQYAGDKVLHDDGQGNFRVDYRDAWYPNFNAHTGSATVEQTFHVPLKNQVVAVGHQVRSETKENETLSVWSADRPVFVTGFNYGRFEKHAEREKNTGVSLEVLTNTGTPNVINRINESLGGGSRTPPGKVVDEADAIYDNPVRPMTAEPTHVQVSTASLAEDAMADAKNSVQVYTMLFGKPPFDRIALSQQAQWDFGQTWPSLIFLPYMAALSAAARAEVAPYFDLSSAGAAAFVDQVTFHEMAHQWWGHTVCWAGYRDQWLSESFAEFSAGLVIELTRGELAYDAFLERWRQHVVGWPRNGSIRYADAGPISLGVRLTTRESPGAYDVVVYNKGPLVLHALRMLMRDDKAKDQDARFVAMLRDFLATYSGKRASTEDFKHIVEKHMIPALDLRHDGKMDWFFDQWIHGVALPLYKVDLQTESVADGKTHIKGTIKQSGVPDDFLAIVPLYVDLGKGRFVRIGKAPFKGSMSLPIDVTIGLPDKPKRVVVNAQHENPYDD